MNVAEKEIVFGGENVLLNTKRSLYWPGRRSLVLSDLHLGKSAYFRKNGLAFPSVLHRKDLRVLDEITRFYQPDRLIITGDMIHAGKNSEVQSFLEWRQKYPALHICLILGNHDTLSAQAYHSIGIDEVCESLQLGAVSLVHIAKEQDGFQIAGHLHPGYELRSIGKKKIRLPSFARSGKTLYLPAFSSFTGLDTRSIADSDCVYYPFTEKVIYEF